MMARAWKTHLVRIVSARARQLSYRLKNRRTAIVSRRENDASLQSRSAGGAWRDANGHGSANGHSSHASPSGFVAVNAARAEAEAHEDSSLASPFMFSQSNTDNVTIINGTSIKGASPTTRAELMKKFFTTADRQARGYDDATGSVNSQPRPRPRVSNSAEHNVYNSTTNASTPVAIPSTPSSLLPPPKTTSQEKDDGGPFKLEMVARMEELQRGERVMPPCDRCRRLHMDCLKNLTACMGCTKKHAKCSWRDVKEDELRAVWPQPLSRERLDGERAQTSPPRGLVTSPPMMPISAERHKPPEASSAPHYLQHSRRDSAPGAPHIGVGLGASKSAPPHDNAPRRAVSETESNGPVHSERPRHAEDEDPDANQRLMQAILDTVDHHARVAAAVQEKERGAERTTERNIERTVERTERAGDATNDGDSGRDRERRMVRP